MPTEVSEEIVLTHPAIPPMVGFKESQFFFQTVTGAAGVNEVQSSLVPTDRYWWIQLAHMIHDDPTARSLRFQLRDTVPNTVAIQTSETNVAATVEWALLRPFILPNDTRLVARSNTIVAGGIITLAFFFYELLHAEINPSP